MLVDLRYEKRGYKTFGEIPLEVADLTQFISHFNTQGCFRRDRFHRGVHKGPGWLLLLLLAPQSGVHRRGAFRDFHSIPSNLIAFEHLSLYIHKYLSVVATNSKSEQ